ncbi:type VI secretion system-associated protein TagO [Cupriavidus basilensis]|uniref:Type VI secretion system-associated protein TagO n=1 Tax=Cupriavidus basilensis TaxID=68895 RepID=A0ABT6AJ65_9BURK|nr:type VI secretion system-associated protein TagO [Cupriavidus basilensis]MDF3832638.1 type VI secretion system-associated protein TagO [Cupriavidus basilensis]
MRALILTFAAALAATGCDSGKPVAAAQADCTKITSQLERLACFDAAAGTPPAPVQPAAESTPRSEPAPVAAEPEIVTLVKRNEAQRGAQGRGLRLLRTPDVPDGQEKILISAPAVGPGDVRLVLAISCLSNISRLQLVPGAPIDVNRVRLRLLLDGRPLGASRPWNVLEEGQVVDAGRGLVAIEQLRPLKAAAGRLQLESDYAPFDGATFDVSELHALMVHQREACHW